MRADVTRQERYSRLLPLVKWLLLLPHYVVLLLLAIAVLFAILGAAVAVLFTRRYPRGLFGFVVGTYRYAWRVSAYLLLMTDRYPPFSLGDEPGFPAALEVSYPEQVDRWRPFVQWLLAIPYLMIAYVLQSLAQWLSIFAFFTILFRRTFVAGMFDLLLVALRFQVRGSAYAGFLTTRYPPFAWG